MDCVQTTLNGFPVYLRRLAPGWVIVERPTDGLVLCERSWNRLPDYIPVPFVNPPLMCETAAIAERELRNYETRFPCDQALLDEIFAETSPGKGFDWAQACNFMLRHPDIAHFVHSMMRMGRGRHGKLRIAVTEHYGTQRLVIGVPSYWRHYERSIEQYSFAVCMER